MLCAGNASAHDKAYAAGSSIRFVENKGQWNDNILFRLKFRVGTLFLERDKLTYALAEPGGFGHHSHSVSHSNDKARAHAFKVHFENCNTHVAAHGREAYADYENYFVGNDLSRWTSGVKAHRSVAYDNLYPGIDLIFEEHDGHLKYSFIVEPNARPENIVMRFEGVDAIFLKDGNLHYSTSVNSIREENIFAFQEIKGSRVEVPCAFKLNDGNVSFEIKGRYDKSLPLIIDPVLIFSTYTGSFADNFGFTATYDNTGHLYAGGIVFDVGYPTTTGAYDPSFNGFLGVDVSITKFTPDGAALIYSTYLGGAESENPSSIIANNQDELIVFGATSSANFPVTAGVYDASFNGGVGKDYASNGLNFTSGTDIFVCKFSAAGSQLIGSTFIGGSGNDGLNDNDILFSFGALVYNYGDQFRGEVVTDGAGNIYAVSSTLSSNFPATAGAFRANSSGGQDAVIFKFNGSLTSLIWSTYLGGSGADAGYNIVIDDQNNVYVSGGTESSNFPATSGSLNATYRGGRADGYVANISANGNALLAATFMGTGAYDQSYFIDQDADGAVYVVGQTEGNYPVTTGVYSNSNSGQYLAALTADLATAVFSTIFGRGDGDPDISPTAFLVDNCKNIYISGWAGQDLMLNVNSTFISTVAGLPVTPDAYQSTHDFSGSDFYFIIFSPNAASLNYATFFGSPNARDHVDGGTSRFDKNGNIYQAVCAGCTGFDDFPTTPGVWSQYNNSSNCNEGLIKFGFEQIGVEVDVEVEPSSMGCVPLTVQFTAEVVNANSFWWDFGDGTTSTLETPVHTYSNDGIYEVTLIGIDTTTCANITFSDTARLAIIARDDSIAARFDPVIISSCDSFIVELNNNSLNAVGNHWDFGDGTTSALASPSHRYAAPGVYDITLIVTNSNACNTMDTIVKQVEMIPDIDVGILISDTLGCVPFTVAFHDASVGGVDFHWNFGDGSFSDLKNPVHTFGDTGTYLITLIVTDSASCNINDTATASVMVFDNRIAAGFRLDTLAFACDSLAISLTNLSSGFTSVLWDFGDGITSTDANPQHVYDRSDSFEIKLIISNPAACNEADTSAQIIFLPSEVKAAFHADNGCPPFDATIVNQSANATSYRWNFWDGTAATDAVPLLTELSSGSYSLTLTAYNPETCNDSSVATGTFTVHDKPVALFDADSVYNLLESVQFISQSAGAVAFAWHFDDGDSSFAENPTHAYPDSGYYIPCLKVTSEYGCDSTYCRRIEIDFRGAIDVPNAFSPNGDGSNDMLYVRGEGIRDLEFRIYNRWGELVFESTDADIVCNELDICLAKGKGWDGTYKGERQEMEVYVYTLRAVFVNGRSSELKKGNITLLR